MPEISPAPLDRPFHRTAAAHSSHRRKLLVVSAVLLVHLGMWLVLKVRAPDVVHDPFAGETIMILTQKPPAHAERPKASAPAPKGSATIFVPPRFSPFAPYSPPAATQPDFLFFACAPQNIDRLSREDRARCNAAGLTITGYNGRRNDVFPRSEVQNPEKWESQMAEKNTPARVPCATVSTKEHMPGPVGGGGPPKEEITGMVDLICAMGVLGSLFK